MLTKYFMRSINVLKYSHVFKEESVFSNFGCLSLSGFDEISMFKAGTSLTEKGRTGKKKVAEGIRNHVMHIELCLLNRKGQAVSGS